ncbi:AAA family ATPase [Candidatus Kaiserbacteria bacterium]|nr:AAA family ATPase [Candidatus Kaiserbacteria bacterium]
MYLKKLTVTGFKSFAKKSELEFSAPITAIVGPNGSGKSNVAESFRFVLGEQSVKSMRGKKGDDLIWGGSEKVSRGNRAAVEIVLNNETRVFPLDFDDIRLERIVHRDGQNEYLINGSNVRLRDVQELLSAANIGPSGHHIISQGEADRILSAGAKERREMIEDALGLKTYQFKKQEALKRLEKTKTNMEQVESLRREHAPHLKYLEKQIKIIEKSLATKAELESVYAEYLKREDTYIAHHFDRLKAAKEVPVSKLESVVKALGEAKAILEAETDNDSERVEITKARDSLQTARQKREAGLREISQLEGKISYLRNVIEQKQKTPESNVMVPLGKVEEVMGVIEKEAEKTAGRDDIQYLKRTIQDVVHTLKAFVEKHQKHKPVSNTEAEEGELKALEKDYETKKATNEPFERAVVKAQELLQDLQMAAQEEETKHHIAEKEVLKLMSDRRELETQITAYERELAVIERDREDFKRELQEAVTLIGSAASRYFNYEIVVDGETVSNEMIASEDRQIQRERRRQLEKLKIKLEEYGSGASDHVVDEYKTAKERDEFLATELHDLQTSIDKLTVLIDDLTEQLNERFEEGIDKISAEFNNFFTLMFGGGKASIKKTVIKSSSDEEDEENDKKPAQEGIELTVNLPNKRVNGLNMLSGGERALTSIALIFAMSQVNPPLFIILDETDAALDEANSRRYGDMINALSEKSQLILITHNRETMSRASVLYGITMGNDGVSKLLSVKFDEAVAVAK